MDDASGMAEGTPVRLNGFTDRLRSTRSQLIAIADPKRAVEFDHEGAGEVPAGRFRWIPWPASAPPTCWATSSSTSPRAATAQHREGRRRNQEPAGAGHSRADGAERQPAADRSRRSSTAWIRCWRAWRQGKGNIGKLLKDEELYNRLNGIAAEGQKLLTDVRNGKGTISKLIYDDALYQEIRSPIKRIDALLAELQAGKGSAGQAAQGPGAV